MSDSADKTFEATAFRRSQAMKEGRFAKSRDISGVAGTAAVLAVLVGSRESIGRAMHTLFMRTHGDLGALARDDTTGIAKAMLGIVFMVAAPAACAAVVVGVAVGFAQSRGVLSSTALTFNPARLNPFPNLVGLFSLKKGGVEVLMGLLRVGVVGYVAYRAVLLDLPTILSFGRVEPAASADRMIEVIVRVVTHALCALAAIAVVDYVKNAITLKRDLRMSRQEVQDETKSQDGDQKVKGRMRARARALARKRSLANVKKATVVISNPTHISVALRYAVTDPAPVVVSKGHDELALQIRAEARKYGIPILENRPLARALDAEVQLGHPVPSAHFAAVARVLAFVFKLKGVSARDVRKRRA